MGACWALSWLFCLGTIASFSLAVRISVNSARLKAEEACPRYPLPLDIPQNDPVIQAAFSKLDAFLSEQVRLSDIPGFFFLVVYDQQIFWSKGYGRNNPLNATSEPPSLNSVVRIASITKVFTDIMLAMLAERGIVSFDDPVNRWLPTFSIRRPYRTNRPITLRQLASHTSGLPRETPCNDTSKCTESQILNSLSKLYTLYPQYETAHYSNLGLSLLGRSLEKATPQKNYEIFVEQNILTPLKMNSSSFDYSKVKNKMAIGVVPDGQGGFVKAPIEDLGWENPDGGLFSSSADMAELIFLFFRSNRTRDSGQQILDSASVNELLLPIILTPDGHSGFGLPLEFEYSNNTQYWIKSKAGALAGYRSQVALVPPIRLGVFSFALRNDLLTDQSESLYTQPVLENILIPAFAKVLWSLQPTKPSLPPNFKLFVGLYQLDDMYWEVYVGADNVLYGASCGGPNSEPVKSPDVNLRGTSFDPLVLRMTVLSNESCRWLEDGPNDELIYCVGNSENNCEGLLVMGQTYLFQSKNCPNCSQ